MKIVVYDLPKSRGMNKMKVPENLTQPLLKLEIVLTIVFVNYFRHYIMAETDRSTCAAEPHCRGDENLVGALTCHIEVGLLRVQMS